MSNKILSFSLLMFFVLFFVAPDSLIAQETDNTDEWQFGAEIYLWGATIEGSTPSGSDIEVDFGDIFDNLEMAFMGVVGARKGKWSMFADVIYLDLEASTNVAPELRLGAEVTAWAITPAVGYNLLESDKIRFDVVGGARYLYLKPELELGSLQASESASFWDGIVGFKGHANLNEKWYLPFYADIGTGQTDLTWQLLGGIGYRFKWFDLNAGYRYLRWDFDSNEALDDLKIHGPFVGVKFEF